MSDVGAVGDVSNVDNVGEQDIRWQQRFDNFKRAYAHLSGAVALKEERPLTALEEQGLIQSFEFTLELAWKVLKDYLVSMQVEAKFPREVIKSAFAYDLIGNGDLWMDMLAKRNLMAHTYDATIAALAQKLICEQYVGQLKALKDLLEEKVV